MSKILITGGSGFLGRRLVHQLLERGDRVTVLARDAARVRHHFPDRVRCASWTPDREGSWAEELAVVDAVVNLAGEPVARRWSPAVKERIEKSRVGATKVLVDAIGKLKQKPGVFVCASATGYYGPRRPDEVLDEDTEVGQGFLAGLVARWEEAARAVEQHGVRAVQIRTGVGLGEGGALDKMLLPFKLFVGGPIGKGDQVVSWVHRDDVVGMILLALDDARARGPINAVSPNPATADELARAIGAVLNRPSWLRVPPAAVRALLGEAAEIVLASQRVRPKKAIELGYEFRYARLVPALESILGEK